MGRPPWCVTLPDYNTNMISWYYTAGALYTVLTTIHVWTRSSGTRQCSSHFVFIDLCFKNIFGEKCDASFQFCFYHFYKCRKNIQSEHFHNCFVFNQLLKKMGVKTTLSFTGFPTNIHSLCLPKLKNLHGASLEFGNRLIIRGQKKPKIF